MKKINKTIIFFDCDNTIWHSKDNDYIGSCKSKVSIDNRGVLIRNTDNKKFYLIKKISKLIIKLASMQSFELGVISDNPKGIVIESLKAYDLYNYFNPRLMNIKLWKGYCPKDQMIHEVLVKNKLDLSRHFILVDDKDYRISIKEAGGFFIEVSIATSYSYLLHKIQKIFNT